MPPNEPLRIAMWSGPRNISTAMMRAWENRADTAVWDEPFYGAYLSETGAPHPGAAQVIEAWGADWRKVVRGILGPVPGGLPIYYQKHMTHHLLAGMDRGWLGKVRNCFLIRDPAAVIASYARTRHTASAEEIGLAQQVAIFEQVRSLEATTPAVLDAADVLRSPEAHLRALCEHLGVPFSSQMLAWPAGPRPTDGVWGKYWYDSVWASSGFMPYRESRVELAPEYADLAAASRSDYEYLSSFRLRP